MAQTNNPLTPVPLPAGAVFADDWQPEDPQPYRVIMGADRGIDGRDLRVRTSAIQFADGRIDGGRIERPGVHVDDIGDHTLTAGQARELAAVLLAAADEVERMAGCDRITVS